jgi:2-phospho-L-lactate/phosphoenolpyruvate guanylyltransferase
MQRPAGTPCPRLDYDPTVTQSHLFTRVAAVIPVRGLEAAKSRLGEALDGEERRRLVEALLRATVAAAAAAPAVREVAVISSDPAVLGLAIGLGATPLEEAGHELGLLAALRTGEQWARERGCDALLILPADLPAVSDAEVERIVVAGEVAAAAHGGGPVVVLVPDRVGTGTNALLVAPPGVIPLRFGVGSRDAHAGEAAAAGAAYVELSSPLSLDIDTPEDVLAAEEAGFVAVVRGAVPGRDAAP